jgi:predicted TIM-barrel fold metal-dependent hydrolase
MTAVSLSAGAMLVLAVAASAQTVDPQVDAYIDAIRAIDNHVHVVAPDARSDTGYDALPCDALSSTSPLAPANLRFGSDALAAWKALYGFSGTGPDEAQVREVAQRQAGVRQQQGEQYFTWVLDQAGIDVALANRTTMPQQLTRPRFLWVPYDDALLFPLDNTYAKAITPDRKVFYEKEEQILRAFLQEDGATTLPPTFDGYLDLVTRTLRRQKDAGAVAIKFEVAYLRSLKFAATQREAAGAVYARYSKGGMPGAAEYKTLQDFLFRYVAAEAGRIGIAVHIHTGTGCGEFFDDEGANPILLGSTLNDATLRPTTFVLLHGGRPMERTMTSLILKPNVYVDTSLLEFLWSPTELARVLRPWLETMPERVMFGTDAGPFGAGVGWEETTWIGSRKTRRALAIALTQMVDERVITASRAREIARLVLRQNAVDLYHLSAR